MSTAHSTPLRFLGPGWFAVVMGLSGLALAWSRAVPHMGLMAGAVALVLGGLAGAVAALLLGLSILRARRYPDALAEDLNHPVRHVFVAAAPVALILVATVAHGVAGLGGPFRWLWMLASAWQLWVTLWVLRRWLVPGQPARLWAGITPVLFIPVVGNVVPALAGVSLGMPEWSAAQWGIGVFFWPVVLVLLLVRVATQGLWPERLLPSTFITVAPPAVIGMGALQLGLPTLVAWAAWGVALFFVLWSASVFPRILAQPFAVTFWGMSFPLAAFSALGLRLADAAPGWFAMLAVLVLALTTCIITFLVLGTWRGLRDGSLLAPEPVATIVPVASESKA